MDHKHTFQILADQYQQIQQKASDLENLQVERYRTSLPELKIQYVQAKAPILTIPVIFGRTYSENFISDYLAYILDPQKNGIGTAPLEQILKLCQTDYFDVTLDIHVRREFQLDNGRIDLLIEIGDFLVIGLENKISSPERPNQTKDYAGVIEKLFPDAKHALIFLTREGYQSSSERFIPVSYGKLWATLKDIDVSQIKETRKVVFWQDFLEHLEVYIMKTDPNHFEFSEKAQLYIDHHEMIQDLTNTFQPEWDKFVEFLENRFLVQETDGPWTTNFAPRSGVQQVFKPNWNSGAPNVHYEWWLSPQSFYKKRMAVMVDIEGRRSEEFFALFDRRYKDIENIYIEQGIIRRPSKWKRAIAFKEHVIDLDINLTADKFIQAFDELKFLTPIIDDVLVELNSKA